MTIKAKTILEKLSAFTDFGARKQEGRAKFEQGIAEAYRSKNRLERLKAIQQGHANWQKAEQKGAEESPVMSKVMLHPLMNSMMNFGQKRIKNTIKKVESGEKGNTKHNPKNAWNRLNAWTSELAARQNAYASKQHGLGNLNMLVGAGLGTAGKKALKDIEKK